MSAAAGRPTFWIALALAVVLGVGTIALLTAAVDASEARGAITLDCGTALAPKSGADIEVNAVVVGGATVTRRPCDDPIRQRRIVAGAAALATVGALVWVGFEIRRAEDDQPITV